MKIKTFTAKSYSEALEMVKKEFGPDAVIIETEEVKDGNFSVKITAAIDFDIETTKTLNKKTAFQSYLSNEFAEENEEALSSPYFYNDEIKEELKEIKKMLFELKMSNKFQDNAAFYNLLKKQGLREEYIEGLLCDLKDEKELYDRLLNDFKAGYRLTNGKTIMFVGPTGVGKTTTILKLASFAIKIGKKVGIINLDSFRLGAFEQMRVFCQLLGIPFCTINDIGEFADIYKEFAKGKEILFIDTTGRNPKDKKYITELKKIREFSFPFEIHLTVSMSMNDEVFIRAKDNYEELGIDYLIFTKLDEAYTYGGIYNIYKTFGKPIAYLTHGQKIPNDIQAVNPMKLTNMILGRGMVQ
jgi:flagellar biosynthesis protein FlhF